jgi:hypothetical protein
MLNPKYFHASHVRPVDVAGWEHRHHRMVWAEHEAGAFTKLNRKARLRPVSKLTRFAGHEIVNSRRSSQVRQPPAEFAGYGHSEMAIRFGSRLTKLPQRFRGERKLHRRHDIRLRLRRQPIWLLTSRGTNDIAMLSGGTSQNSADPIRNRSRVLAFVAGLLDDIFV